MKKIINLHIKENTDSYRWSELNCFYKAFAIALNSFNDNYFNTFVMYISAYILYGIKGEGYLSFNANDCILEYYKRELETIFGCKIEKEEFRSHKNMCRKIYNILDKNNIVIAPCDLFYLPYSKSYLELHKRHYMIIKGIDVDKGIVYILDNMHNELGAGTKYTDFMIETKVLYEMAGSFQNQFDDISNSNYLWSISKYINDNFENNKRNYHSRKYLLKLCDNLLNTSNYLEMDIINELQSGDYGRNMRKYLMYSNHRVVFLESIKYYLYDKAMLDMSDNILIEWKNIKLQILVAYERGKIDLNNLKERVKINIENEKKIFAYIKDNLSDFDVKDRVDSKENPYEIKNRNNAKVLFNKNNAEIILDAEITYDIWSNCENGVIIKKDFESADKLEVMFDIQTELGSSSQCGIYIELCNGKRILFGSLGRLNMAIHMIDEGKDYEKCIYQEIVEDRLYLSVEYDEEYCRFYSKDSKEAKYELELSEKIVKLGMFAKTWEHCYLGTKIEIL